MSKQENDNGERCNRCRARAVEWQFADLCGDQHERICDKCHGAVHIEAGAYVTPHLGDWPENKLTELIAELINNERLKVHGDAAIKRDGLRVQIEDREAAFNDPKILDKLFQRYLDEFPTRPSHFEERELYGPWKGTMLAELADLRDQRADLEDSFADDQSVRDRALTRLLQLFCRAAQDAGLRESSPGEPLGESVKNGTDAQAAPESWTKLSIFRPNVSWEKPPRELWCPRDGKGIRIDYWADLYGEIAEWLVRQGLIKHEDCPIYIKRGNNYSIHTEPIQHDGKEFRSKRELSSGVFLDTVGSADCLVDYTKRLLKKYGADPGEFFVKV